MALIVGNMTVTYSQIGYVNRIFQNVADVDPGEFESLYHDVASAGVIIPSGEGRSKGALSIGCSEMAKMKRGKLIFDRSDVGFPGRNIDEAAPILRQRFGQVSLLIVSGSGRSMTPLIDAQKLAIYMEKIRNYRDYRIDVITSDKESPIGRLGSKYGSVLGLKGRRQHEIPEEPSQFRTYGILEDLFILGSGLIVNSMAEAICEERGASYALTRSRDLSTEIGRVVDQIVESEFFDFVLGKLEERCACFFGGLGSSNEVGRMTAVRVGHVKRALGDQVYVAGESNTPNARPGDLMIAVSYSGETEIVASWCKNFKRIGGKVASIVGRRDSTIASTSDVVFVIENEVEEGRPNSFYVKAAFSLSPLPIYLVERAEMKGLRLPEYILRWHHSVTS